MPRRRTSCFTRTVTGQLTQMFEDEPALIRCLPELNTLRIRGKLTDLSINLQDNVTLHVHRVILISRVPSLCDIVCEMPRERKAVLRWPKVPSEIARPLIDYIYTGQLKVCEATAAGLVVLSKQLSLTHVEEWAASFIVDSGRLMTACLQHIKTNFETTIANDLQVGSEESVFEAIRLWVSPCGEIDEMRVVHAAAMMKEVRWNRINPEFRCKLLDNDGFWNRNVDCLRLLGRIAGWFECPSSRAGRECPFNTNRRSTQEAICLAGTSASSGQSVLIRYDANTKTSEQLNVSGDRIYATLVAIEDCVFAIGTLDQYGSYKKVEKFDTRELVWSARAPLSTGRQYYAAVAVPVGRECVICVLGGYNCNGYGYLNTCELYSPQEDRWYALPELKERKQCAAAVALPDGRVFVIGGQSASGYWLNSVETCHLREPADWQGRRNTSGDFWKNAASMASPRSGHAAVAFRGSIFVAGGSTSSGRSAVEVFAPPDNQQPLGQWTQLTNSTLKWSNSALVVWEDRLFSFCSKGNSSVSMLEFVPPPSSSTPSRKDYASWTWSDRGKVDYLKSIQKALILR
ncbi:Kelch-like protein 24 [Sparganum proliferum]